MEPPLAVIDCDWNNTVVIAGRMVHAAGISFILPAEQALRISALFSQFGCCDSFRIFLRFGQINRKSRSPYLVLVTHFISLQTRYLRI